LGEWRGNGAGRHDSRRSIRFTGFNCMCPGPRSPFPVHRFFAAPGELSGELVSRNVDRAQAIRTGERPALWKSGRFLP
jgi:hypothetical protein